MDQPVLTVEGLGESFDRWINFRVLMAQNELRLKIDANFEYDRRMREQWRLWETCGIWMFDQTPVPRTPRENEETRRIAIKYGGYRIMYPKKDRFILPTPQA